MRPVQEAAGAGLLHNLGTRVAAHATEGVVAENNGTVFHTCVGDDELTVWGESEENEERC